MRHWGRLLGIDWFWPILTKPGNFLRKYRFPAGNFLVPNFLFSCQEMCHSSTYANTYAIPKNITEHAKYLLPPPRLIQQATFYHFPSINPFSVFMIHCDLVIPGIKGAFKDQKAHSFTRPILVSRRTYSRVIVDAATTLILKIRPHFRKILRVYKHLTSSKQQPLKSRRPLT